MYKSLVLGKSIFAERNKEIYKLKIKFYAGHSEHKETSILLKSSEEVLSIVNELPKLENWFSQNNVGDLIENELLKEYIVEEIFEYGDENLELRFDDGLSSIHIVWFNKCGDELPVELSES